MAAAILCNRYRVDVPEWETLAAFFTLDGLSPDLVIPNPEIFPKRLGPVVYQLANGVRHGELMTWGFPPPGAAKSPVTNVRNLTSGFWRRELATPSARCLIPVSQFCEWEGDTPGSKIARWFEVLDRPLFAFAGLWRLIEGRSVYAFLTCEPNPLVAPIHPKAMPVILHESDYAQWLNGSQAAACELVTPFPSQLMSVS